MKGYAQRTEARFHVVAYDFGVKKNILRMLAERGVKLTVVPAQTPAADGAGADWLYTYLRAESPMLVEHTQSTAADTWAVDTGGLLPFGGRARNVVGLVFEGAVSNSANATQYVTPYVQVEQGAGAQFANLKWPVAVKGN